MTDNINEKIERVIYFLKNRLSIPFSLKINNNSSVVIGARRKDGFLSISLHHIFLYAKEKILEAVADFIKNPRSRPEILKDFIKNNHLTIRKKICRPDKARGKCYNLTECIERLNKKYFENKIDAKIGWGRQSRKGARKIALGSCKIKSAEITINPLLDNPHIPEYFLEFIVYHEMLHIFLGFEEKNGRKYAHTSVFRDYEKRFEEYEKAKEFEKIFFKNKNHFS